MNGDDPYDILDLTTLRCLWAARTNHRPSRKDDRLP